MQSDRTATISSLALGLALIGCAEPPLAKVGDPCSPAGVSQCGADLVCCSTDPTAIDYADPSATVLPIYPGFNDVGGVPSFSHLANQRSRRGICIQPGTVPPAGRLPDSECFVPCNPTWSTADVAAVCGANTICCQAVELDAEDCVLDEYLGDAGCWRPVVGADIGVLSDWGIDEHATHQDPGLLAGGACASLIAGLPPGLDAAVLRSACERRLTVANQRGMCLGGNGANICPEQQPSYRDACERINDAQARSGCD